jgi:hypothetical protein
MKSVRQLGTSLVLSLMLPRLAVPAEPWYETYAAGLKAIEGRQWALAETKLRQAMKDGPPEGRNTRAYGMRFILYIPSYHLAVVEFHQGRYQEAAGRLKQVQASRLVSRSDPEYGDLSEMLETMAAREAAKAEPSPLPPPPATQPSHAQEEIETLVRSARSYLRDGNPTDARRAFEAARAKDATDPELPSLAEALVAAEAARDAKIAASRATSAGPAEQAASQQKRTEFDQLLDLAGAQLASKRPRQAQEAALKAKALGISDPRLDDMLAVTEHAVQLDELQRLVARKDWSAAQRRARELATRNAQDPDLLRLAGVIEQALNDRPRIDAESAGIRAFYGGRYSEAIDLLIPLSAGPSPSAKALYYLACSQAALGLMRGPEGQEHLAKAAANVATMRRMKLPAPLVDVRLISPRILHALEGDKP